MCATLCDRTIDKVAVVGSGEIGPDIALHFTKELHDRDIPVVVLDIEAQALDRGRSRLQKKVEEGTTRDIYSEQAGESMIENVIWTQSADDLEGANLVIEAAPEEVDVKKVIYEGLEHRCPEDAILASSSSHLPPEWIFEDMMRPERAMILHYFFPAERNQLLEIVPGEETDPELVRWAQEFYEFIGKAPITSGSRFGYAIDPIFEGIVQTSMQLVEDGVGSVKQIDAAVQDLLGRENGPFTLLNKIGGNVIVEVGMNGAHEEIMPWFQAPDLLEEQIRSGEQWDVAGRGEDVEYNDELFERVETDIQATYFGLVNEVLDSGISDVADLDLGLEVGMNAHSPFEWMNDLGLEESLQRVESFAGRQEGFRVGEPLRERAKSGTEWEIPRVLREDRDDVAVVRLRRWSKHNALDELTLKQLRTTFAQIQDDDAIRGAVLTGFGRNAFAAGADIGMLADMDGPDEAEQFSLTHHETLRKIETMEEPVVAALNGIALGGGSELALSCNARLAADGVSRLIGQPEPALGLIPGLGGTQRLPRIIGLRPAWELLRTAGSLSSDEADELGLVMETVPGDRLLEHAVHVTREAADGERSLSGRTEGALSVPDELPDVDIGHLSKKIDDFLQKAVLEGAETVLEEGVEIEASYFGKCFETEDARIGIQNFLQNGPGTKAIFVDR